MTGRLIEVHLFEISDDQAEALADKIAALVHEGDGVLYGDASVSSVPWEPEPDGYCLGVHGESDEDLPTLSSILGSVPGLTGGLSAEEYVKRNRR
jgi:hypothetical protein